jgi:serine/threonine protein kinase
MLTMAGLEIPTNPRFEAIDLFFEDKKTIAGLAYDHEVCDGVFIKVKQPDYLAAATRMEREADVLASLSHPQIPKLIEINTSGAAPYVVTQFKRENPYLRQRTAHGLPAELAARLCASALTPLSYVHDQGITHRDFKTKNLLLHDVKGVTLVDFELAYCKDEKTAERVYVSASENRPDITTIGRVVGTSNYVAPEQVTGARPTPAFDIYAAGIVLFELLYGRVPFTGSDEVAVRYKHLRNSISYDSDKNVPDSLVAVIDRATQKDPCRRYESAGAMSEDLQRFLGSTAWAA